MTWDGLSIFQLIEFILDLNHYQMQNLPLSASGIREYLRRILTCDMYLWSMVTKKDSKFDRAHSFRKQSNINSSYSKVYEHSIYMHIMYFQLHVNNPFGLQKIFIISIANYNIMWYMNNPLFLNQKKTANTIYIRYQLP